ncbi:hypothetical protein CPB83DRAFT_926922 [Crepidotus variabilis]|uniref:Uncharacterized protein n=1 Tax=Crepidotus variabilis TaxID=179855 RepID=A0A9P6E097_9AGAR|nr:hypothetical protein CPB83DRAFT_926922 [Crepidotus variabilis]
MANGPSKQPSTSNSRLSGVTTTSNAIATNSLNATTSKPSKAPAPAKSTTSKEVTAAPARTATNAPARTAANAPAAPLPARGPGNAVRLSVAAQQNIRTNTGKVGSTSQGASGQQPPVRPPLEPPPGRTAANVVNPVSQSTGPVATTTTTKAKPRGRKQKSVTALLAEANATIVAQKNEAAELRRLLAEKEAVIESQRDDYPKVPCPSGPAGRADGYVLRNELGVTKRTEAALRCVIRVITAKHLLTNLSYAKQDKNAILDAEVESVAEANILLKYYQNHWPIHPIMVQQLSHMAKAYKAALKYLNNCQEIPWQITGIRLDEGESNSEDFDIHGDGEADKGMNQGEQGDDGLPVDPGENNEGEYQPVDQDNGVGGEDRQAVSIDF